MTFGAITRQIIQLYYKHIYKELNNLRMYVLYENFNRPFYSFIKQIFHAVVGANKLTYWYDTTYQWNRGGHLTQQTMIRQLSVISSSVSRYVYACIHIFNTVSSYYIWMMCYTQNTHIYDVISTLHYCTDLEDY